MEKLMGCFPVEAIIRAGGISARPTLQAFIKKARTMEGGPVGEIRTVCRCYAKWVCWLGRLGRRLERAAPEQVLAVVLRA